MYNYNQEMMRLIIISIVALFHLSGTAGECPSMDEVPVMYNKETFMCASNYAIIFIHIVFDQFLFLIFYLKAIKFLLIHYSQSESVFHTPI